MKDIERFIKGFRVFQKEYFGADSHFEELKHGQSPKTMVIGCADSRVDPAILTNSKPGDLFIVRNVANLVPPYEKDGGQHGVSAALEYAVCSLEVEHIIVLGHSRCGGIGELMEQTGNQGSGNFISRWISLAAPARDRILAEFPDKDRKWKQRATEQAAILLSIENLHSFPFITRQTDSGALSLHGWYFDIVSGELFEYDTETRAFHSISGDIKD